MQLDQQGRRMCCYRFQLPVCFYKYYKIPKPLHQSIRSRIRLFLVPLIRLDICRLDLFLGKTSPVGSINFKIKTSIILLIQTVSLTPFSTAHLIYLFLLMLSLLCCSSLNFTLTYFLNFQETKKIDFITGKGLLNEKNDSFQPFSKCLNK